MTIPNTQIKLLKDILEDFELNITIDNRTYSQIYECLFMTNRATASFADAALQNTVLMLKDIVEMGQMTTLEEIINFFEEEDRAIDDFMQDVIQALQSVGEPDDEKYDPLYFDSDICTMKPEIAVRPALSRYVVTSNHYNQESFVEALVKLTPKLNQYFYINILNTVPEKKVLIKDLIQETAAEAYLTYCNRNFEQYSIETIIFIKAKLVLSDLRAKEEKKETFTSDFKILNDFLTPSLESAFEARNLLEYLKQTTKASDLSILTQLSQGFTIKEIAAFHSKSTNKIRATINQCREKNRKLFIDF